jgi:hypothetical protein
VHGTVCTDNLPWCIVNKFTRDALYVISVFVLILTVVKKEDGRTFGNKVPPGCVQRIWSSPCDVLAVCFSCGIFVDECWAVYGLVVQSWVLWDVAIETVRNTISVYELFLVGVHLYVRMGIDDVESLREIESRVRDLRKIIREERRPHRWINFVYSALKFKHFTLRIKSKITYLNPGLRFERVVKLGPIYNGRTINIAWITRFTKKHAYPGKRNSSLRSLHSSIILVKYR